LEPAAYGIPVFFGPRFTSFKEAEDLIASGVAFSIRDAADLKSAWKENIPRNLNAIKSKSAQYFADNKGATAKIIDYLRPLIEKISVIEALKSLDNTKVLVIGDIILDIYINGKVDRISPEAPVPVVNHTHTHHALGGASNVAANLRGLNVETKLIAVIGRDTEGEYLETMLDLEDISHDLLKIENRPTTSKSRIIAGNHQMLRIDHEADNELPEEPSGQLWDLIVSSMESFKPDAIVLEDYNKGLFTSDLIAKISKEARLRSIPVIVDPKNNNFFDFKVVHYSNLI
jgi:hypothetical protein